MGAVGFCYRGRRQANRGGAASDQQVLAFCKTQRPEQRAPSRLQHLWQGAKRFPRELCLDRLDLLCRDAGVFGIAAVKVAPEAAHDARDHISFREISTWRVFDNADYLY